MTTLEQEEILLKQLALQQHSEVEVLLLETSLATDDELCTIMKEKSASVVASIEECFKRPGNPVFQKNFLVIAKSFTNELGDYLHQCFRQKQSLKSKLCVLQQINASLLNMIVTAIKQFQTGNTYVVQCVNEDLFQ